MSKEIIIKPPIEKRLADPFRHGYEEIGTLDGLDLPARTPFVVSVLSVNLENKTIEAKAPVYRRKVRPNGQRARVLPQALLERCVVHLDDSRQNVVVEFPEEVSGTVLRIVGRVTIRKIR